MTPMNEERAEAPRTNDAGSSPIEILLAADSKYAPYLATTIYSIVKNGAREDRFRFHTIDAGLSEKDRAILNDLARELDFELALYRFDLDSYRRELNAASATAFPIVVNYRLFAGLILPKTVDKVLYFDVDVAVLGSLRELWETPLNDSLCAAVLDPGATQQRVDAMGLPSDWRYFNSGVLSINLKKWRDEKIVETFLEIFEEKKDAIGFPDQDVLNIAASRSSYVALDERWNCHPTRYVEGETRVLHYCGRRQRAPHLDVWFKLAAATPYKKLPFQRLSFKASHPLKRILAGFLSLFLFKKKWRRRLRRALGIH